MDKAKNVHTFLGLDSDYEEAKIVVFGAPFDGTTSFRPGTRFASSVMRNESYGLEMYSPYLDKDLKDTKICDVGDLVLPIGNTEKSMEVIKEFAKEIVEDGKIPMMIGGDHLVSYPAIEAVYEKHKDIYVLHFDAHTDLRDTFFGEKLSHANVLRRTWDFLGDGRIYQFGIRSGDREEFLWAEEHTHLTKFNYDGLDEVVEKLKEKAVYVTIDIDILDPSVVPGTGTPEPGGISFKEMLDILSKINKLNNIVGADLVELAPHYDPTGVSSAVACKIFRELALVVHK
ncbi:agmatinase [Sporanaerobacter acetigenes]|uniref:Agmatinase n=1 Tax=Sporanaerobacter acetigenes DSM 13106 TaxID=1123281 RepID=A0A1M5VKP2_9FIRM|nr:agmatinase [Sporanaerobacter acetigenes]SHH75614.1 agmatinase [Sporanaerobacter acetigenes DSM 13106]